MASLFESFASAIGKHAKHALKRVPPELRRWDKGIKSAFRKLRHGPDAASSRSVQKRARAPHPSHAKELPSHAKELPSHAKELPSHAKELPSHTKELLGHAKELPGHPKEPHVIENFGSNPGGLIMRLYTPPHPRQRPALVVVLHGCKQNAKIYDKGSGWSKLADRGGFLLLYPEQQRRNNPGICFNWFERGDTARDRGEASSIRQMIAQTVSLYDADPARIFICGLSAGGAMTNVMLACYPEVFAAGAIIAGLPYGAAASAKEALEAMYNGTVKNAEVWGDLVRAASRHEGHWPNIAVWHGSLDATVKPVNAGEIVKQWTNVHGLGGTGPACEQAGAITVRSWQDSKGTPRIVEYMVAGMGHGAPIAGHGGTNDGAAVPFFLSTGVWSSLRIAQDWGLFDKNGLPVKSSRFALPSFNSRMNHFSRGPEV